MQFDPNLLATIVTLLVALIGYYFANKKGDKAIKKVNRLPSENLANATYRQLYEDLRGELERKQRTIDTLETVIEKLKDEKDIVNGENIDLRLELKECKREKKVLERRLDSMEKQNA